MDEEGTPKRRHPSRGHQQSCSFQDDIRTGPDKEEKAETIPGREVAKRQPWQGRDFWFRQKTDKVRAICQQTRACS